MSLIEQYFQQTGMLRGFQAKLLDGLDDAQGYWQPGPNIPPIAWHLGHLIYVEASVFLGLVKGAADPEIGSYQKHYRMGTVLPEPIAALPKLSEVRKLGEAWRPRVAEFLKTLNPHELERPLNVPAGIEVPAFLKTPGDCLRALAVHEGHHNGEISLLRRLQGLKGFI